MKRQPADADITVAATIFAFMRNDIDTARKRLTNLVSTSEANRKFRAAHVNLYLAAEAALQHEETADMGRRLSTLVMQAGEQMNDEWKQFFHSKKSDHHSTTGN